MVPGTADARPLGGNPAMTWVMATQLTLEGFVRARSLAWTVFTLTLVLAATSMIVHLVALAKTRPFGETFISVNWGTSLACSLVMLWLMLVDGHEFFSSVRSLVLYGCVGFLLVTIALTAMTTVRLQREHNKHAAQPADRSGRGDAE